MGVKRALKIIPVSKISNTTNFFHEAQILQKVLHENIVEIKETGWFDQHSIYVAMEYLKRGSLEDEAQKKKYLYLSRAKRILIDTLRGLEHAHYQQILHRDIKPGNILIGNSGEAKLSDFGLSLPLGKNPKDVGMKEYWYRLHIPPEIINGKEYSIKSEIYSSGVTLYRLINGDEFFPTAHPNFLSKIQQGKIPDRTRYRAFVPTSLKKVVNKALNVNPDKRFETVNEMRRALERLSLIVNWDEKRLQNGGFEWKTGLKDQVYVLKAQPSTGGWEVKFYQGKNLQKLRKVNRLCRKGITKNQASAKVRKILHGLAHGIKLSKIYIE